MSGSSATQTPPVSPAEMQVLVSRAGLTLNPGQMADLVLAWRQVAGLLALVQRERPLADDQAFVFRLPAPGSMVGEAPAGARAPRMAKAPPPKSAKPPTRTRAGKQTAAGKAARRGR